jgi:uncharacterized membrane protein YeaQ/YmgE (transglycosylase-associated protein family)
MVGEVIGAILLGIVAGYVGKLLMPGKDPGGFLVTVALGVVGSLVGYFLFTALLGIGDDDKFDFGGIIGAILGVMILLGIYRMIAPKPRPPAPTPTARRERAADRAERRRNR